MGILNNLNKYETTNVKEHLEKLSSYVMMPCYSLTWYFSPVIFQLFPSFDPKFQ